MAQTLTRPASSLPRLALAVIPWVAWFYLFYPVVHWIGHVFLADLKVFNLFMLVAVVFFLAIKTGKRSFALPPIQLHWDPLAASLCVLAAVAYPLAWELLTVNIGSAFFFGWGTYGLLGLYIPRDKWRQSFIPALLLIQTLPFGALLDTYLGFPLRVFITELVSQGFAVMGYGGLTNETILIIENRAAQVDLDCSGLKGLWSGSLFFFAITWVEGWRVTWRWWLLGGLLIALIISANLFRIGILVYLTTVQDLPAMAESLHEPLGLFGFIFSCGIIYLLIRYWPKGSSAPEKFSSSHPLRSFPRWLPFTLAAFFVLTSMVRPGPIAKEQAPSLPPLKIENWHLESAPLSAVENKFMLQEGGQAVKYRFATDTFSGSLVLVGQGPWRSHHQPEICAQANGFHVNGYRTLLLDSDFSVKQLDLNDHLCSQFYWFQSSTAITDDFSARVWAELTGKNTQWTMVSVLFDQPITADNLHARQQLLALRAAVHQHYFNPQQP